MNISMDNKKGSAGRAKRFKYQPCIFIAAICFEYLFKDVDMDISPCFNTSSHLLRVDGKPRFRAERSTES